MVSSIWRGVGYLFSLFSSFPSCGFYAEWLSVFGIKSIVSVANTFSLANEFGFACSVYPFVANELGARSDEGFCIAAFSGLGTNEFGAFLVVYADLGEAATVF